MRYPGTIMRVTARRKIVENTVTLMLKVWICKYYSDT